LACLLQPQVMVMLMSEKITQSSLYNLSTMDDVPIVFLFLGVEAPYKIW
jgi:hypothetical protein